MLLLVEDFGRSGEVAIWGTQDLGKQREQGVSRWRMKEVRVRDEGGEGEKADGVEGVRGPRSKRVGDIR